MAVCIGYPRGRKCTPRAIEGALSSSSQYVRRNPFPEELIPGREKLAHPQYEQTFSEPSCARDLEAKRLINTWVSVRREPTTTTKPWFMRGHIFWHLDFDCASWFIANHYSPPARSQTQRGILITPPRETCLFAVELRATTLISIFHMPPCVSGGGGRGQREIAFFMAFAC